MQPLFLIGPPDSSLDRAAAVVRSGSRVALVPAGGLLTALLHVGVAVNIEKAAYDHVLAGPAQRLFLDRVQGGLGAWYAACRAYTDSLVSAASLGAQAPWLLDSAPEYAHLWPLIQRIFPEAVPVVLVRNPVATAAAVLARDDSPRARRQLQAAWEQLAAQVEHHGDLLPLVRYESLLRAPVAELAPLEGLLGAHAAHAEAALEELLEQGLAEEAAWPAQLAADTALLQRVRTLLEQTPASQLAAVGYPWEAAWEPVNRLLGSPVRPRRIRVAAHAGRRALLRRLRAWCHRHPSLERGVRKVRLATEVLLRT